MSNKPGQLIYALYAPAYDLFFKPFSDRARQRAIQILDLQSGERLFMPGIGTGLDLPHIPEDISITGIDLNGAMLSKARKKAGEHDITLQQMDAQNLDFLDATFDAVLMCLVVSVVPDGGAAFHEAWRVLRPGGRLVIFDKFLADDARLTPVQRVIGRIVSMMGTDPNRRLSDITRRE